MIDAIKTELTAAAGFAAREQFQDGFRHLERAHILSQSSTRQHVRVHYRMLCWAVLRKDRKEILGQLLRIVGAATKTAIGLIPSGNTGGANVSPFRSMPVPEDLKVLLPADRPYRRAAMRLGFLAALIFAFLLVAYVHAPRPQTVLVDGRSVAYHVTGHGRPIVFIAGLGDGMETFEDVARDLGRTNTVITYDRAGYGGSTARTGLHDAAAAERELSGMLAATRIPGPYVLVGHSLGGLYAEYYASRHPDQVSALILEESRPSGFTTRCAAAGQSACVPPSWALWLMPKPARQEAGALAIVSAQAQRASPVRSKPVLVLSKPLDAKPDRFDQLWTHEQAVLAARYPGSQHLTAPGGGHYIHKDEREWFVRVVHHFWRSPGKADRLVKRTPPVVRKWQPSRGEL
jgi:pimeloyl-ACP methyl ester carboxylesterase